MKYNLRHEEYIGFVAIYKKGCSSAYAFPQSDHRPHVSTKYLSRDMGFQHCGMCVQQSIKSACAYAQSDQSLCFTLDYSMSGKLPTEHHLEFLSLKGGCTGSCESTLVKMPHCRKSRVTAHLVMCKT